MVISSPLKVVVSPRTEISKCYEGTTLIIRTVLYRERNSGRAKQGWIARRDWEAPSLSVGHLYNQPDDDGHDPRSRSTEHN